MDYREHQSQTWESLAIRYGRTSPLRAVISTPAGWRGSLTNYYYDKTSKQILSSAISCSTEDTILDLGCGIGRLSTWFAPRVRSVIGLDISPEMIQIATGRAAAMKLTNVDFLVSDGRRLPIAPGSISIVLCCSTLKYVMDDADMSVLASDIASVIKPQGQLVIIEQVDENGPVILSGQEDIAGQSILRSSRNYSELFASRNLKHVAEYSLYNRTAIGVYMRLTSGVNVSSHSRLVALGGKLAAQVDLRLDGLMKHRLKRKRGFRALVYKNKPGSADEMGRGADVPAPQHLCVE